jgi:hypothetical protein
VTYSFDILALDGEDLREKLTELTTSWSEALIVHPGQIRDRVI